MVFQLRGRRDTVLAFRPEKEELPGPARLNHCAGWMFRASDIDSHKGRRKGKPTAAFGFDSVWVAVDADSLGADLTSLFLDNG
jgi:hypothetical protein